VKEEETWSISAKKRKKIGKEQDLIKGLKIRKTSSTDKSRAHEAIAKPAGDVEGDSTAVSQVQGNQPMPGKTTETSKSSTQKAVLLRGGLGLAAYSSDEDD
jgi:hypothetical protein